MRQVQRGLKIAGGFSLLGVGLLMMFTPGPGWLAILAALGILAAEFLWARSLLEWMKSKTLRLRDAVFVRSSRPDAT